MDGQQTANTNAQPAADQPVEEVTDRVAAVKDKALQELMPLVDQLEEPPERKFEILMMALRSAFSEELLEKTLETATKIEDKTARAEAMLDLINEASYQNRA